MLVLSMHKRSAMNLFPKRLWLPIWAITAVLLKPLVIPEGPGMASPPGVTQARAIPDRSGMVSPPRVIQAPAMPERS
jgi:hypothetical protein